MSGVDPVFMVAGDLWGEGHDNALVVDFGPVGLWLYHSTDHSWQELSGLSPDDSDAL
jgi:hypothetical protein